MDRTREFSRCARKVHGHGALPTITNAASALSPRVVHANSIVQAIKDIKSYISEQAHWFVHDHRRIALDGDESSTRQSTVERHVKAELSSARSSIIQLLAAECSGEAAKAWLDSGENVHEDSDALFGHCFDGGRSGFDNEGEQRESGGEVQRIGNTLDEALSDESDGAETRRKCMNTEAQVVVGMMRVLLTLHARVESLYLALRRSRRREQEIASICRFDAEAAGGTLVIPPHIQALMDEEAKVSPEEEYNEEDDPADGNGSDEQAIVKKTNIRLIEPTVRSPLQRTSKLRRRAVSRSSSASLLDRSLSDVSSSSSSLLDDQQFAASTSLQLTEEQRQVFEQENKTLLNDLECLMEEVQRIEHQVLEIAQLQDDFVGKVSEQAEEIELIHTLQADSTTHLRRGAQNLREASSESAQFRVFILVLLVTLSAALLFIHWYD